MSTSSAASSRATFVAYIDESGDEGFRFGRESSEWFVFSAVVTRKATDLETVKLIDAVRAHLGKPPKRYGYCEDRYARMLKPVTYHHRGSYLGYGLKFWPGEVAGKMRAEERFDWIRSSFAG